MPEVHEVEAARQMRGDQVGGPGTAVELGRAPHVTIVEPDHLEPPARQQLAELRNLVERERGRPVDRDPVVVVEVDELAEPELRGEPSAMPDLTLTAPAPTRRFASTSSMAMCIRPCGPWPISSPT